MPAGAFLAARFVWSPDGRQIGVALQNATGDNTWQIALVSVADGSMAQLKSTGWRNPMLAGFSPDGRFLMYTMSNSQLSNHGGIFTLAVDGSRQTALVTGPNNDTLPAWAPDGRTVVFVSDRSGTQGFWSLRVEKGKPQGPPELLRASVGQTTVTRFSRDGSFFYGLHNEQRDIYVVGIDPETFSVKESPVVMVDRFLGSNHDPAWSPDGRLIAFYRGTGYAPGATALVVRSVSDGSERSLLAKLVAPDFSTRSDLNWFPASRSLLVSDVDYASQRITFRQVDVETGKEKVAFDAGYREVFPLVKLSSDGQSLYYSTYPSDKRLVKRNLGTGRETELYRPSSQSPGGFRALCVSPDGSRLAFFDETTDPKQWRLMTVPTEGGAPREIARSNKDRFDSRAIWTKDGQHVLVNYGFQGQVWVFSFHGESPRQIDLAAQRLLNLAMDLSLDGRRLVHTEVHSGNPERWMIKNLLPKTPAAR